jgi:hypothetical protein
MNRCQFTISKFEIVNFKLYNKAFSESNGKPCARGYYCKTLYSFLLNRFYHNNRNKAASMKRLYSNIIDLTGFDCDEDEEEESVQPPIPFKLSVRPDPELKFPPGNSHRLGRSSAAISRTPSDGSYKLSDWWGSATSIIPALAASAARMVTSPKAALASVVSSVTANGALSPKESSQPASSSLRTDSFSMSTSPSPSPSCPFPALTPQGTRVIKKPCVDLSMSDEDSPLPSLKVSHFNSNIPSKLMK